MGAQAAARGLIMPFVVHILNHLDATVFDVDGLRTTPVP
jgi:hypothetical protein